jgi:hypothetical protein
MDFKNKWLPLVIAVAVGLVAAGFYVMSGRSSYDLGVRNLSVNGDVAKVEATDARKISVKCRNGENYEISFKEDQGDYAGLVFDACGPEGAQE